MLFLASLLGLVAVGSVTFIDTDTGDETDDDTSAEGTGLSGADSGNGQIMSGGELDNFLSGGSGPDQINGYDGDDSIAGAGGNDDLHGGKGNDQIAGNAGDDTLYGDGGDDVLMGGAQDDDLFGHNDHDTIYGGLGDDTLTGGAGDDVLYGGDGNDTLLGGLGDDILSGNDGADTLFGGWGDDLISGIKDDPGTAGFQDIDQADFLNGGGGDDTILAGQDDIVTGGEGADTIVFGDWISLGHTATMIDFEAAQDRLILVWDDSVAPEPLVDVEADQDNPDLAHILLNGKVVADIHGGADLSAQDIVLLSKSATQIISTEPALAALLQGN